MKISPKPHPKRILLLPICGLGDSVCYLPFLQAIRAQFPTAEIVTVVATAAAASIFKDNCSGVELVVFNRSEQKNRWLSLARLLWSIRKRKFEVVISGAHPNSVRVPLFAWLSGARFRIGAASEKLSFLYNERVDVSTHAHYVDRYEALVKKIGVTVSSEDANAKLRPPASAEHSAKRLWNEAGLNGSELVIGMVSGADNNARGQWQPFLKRWGNEGYAEVAKWAHRDLNARVVMFGSGSESALANEVAALAGVPIVNLCGKTALPELQWIISRCAAIVSNDTGTMHLAGALGTQVLALFGPTSPKSFHPPGTRNLIIEGRASCAPCYPHPTCDLKTCRAMNNITPEQVISHLAVLLKTGRTSTINS